MKKQKILQLASEIFGLDPEHTSCRFFFGQRLGFAHSELVCKRLPVPASLSGVAGHSLIVASDAHKSGFLFCASHG